MDKPVNTREITMLAKRETAPVSSAQPATPSAGDLPPLTPAAPIASVPPAVSPPAPWLDDESPEGALPSQHPNGLRLGRVAVLMGHLLAPFVGLSIGYYVLCCIRPEQFNWWNLPLPRGVAAEAPLDELSPSTDKPGRVRRQEK